MFYDIFTELCGEAGISVKKAMKELGLNQSTVGMWKSRGSRPNMPTIAKMADFFGVSMRYLMGLEDTKGGVLGNASTEDYEGLAENIAKATSPETRLNFHFKQLNDKGQEKAIEVVEAFTKVPEYQKGDVNAKEKE